MSSHSTATLTPPAAVAPHLLSKATRERVDAGEDALHARQTIRVTPAVVGGNDLAEEVKVPNLRRLRLGESRPKGHRLMSVPTEDAGDERFSWDASDFSQISEAKRFFNEMIAKGMVAFYVDPKGHRSGQAMVEFDPHAEDVHDCHPTTVIPDRVKVTGQGAPRSPALSRAACNCRHNRATAARSAAASLLDRPATACSTKPTSRSTAVRNMRRCLASMP